MRPLFGAESGRRINMKGPIGGHETGYDRNYQQKNRDARHNQRLVGGICDPCGDDATHPDAQRKSGNHAEADADSRRGHYDFRRTEKPVKRAEINFPRAQIDSSSSLLSSDSTLLACSLGSIAVNCLRIAS